MALVFDRATTVPLPGTRVDRRRGRRFLLPGMARWCYRRRRLVVVLWLLALAASSLAVHLVGTAYDDSYTLPHAQSSQAQALLRAAGGPSGDEEQLVVSVEHGRVSDPAVQARVAGMLARLAQLPDVAGVAPPGAVSPDGRVTLAGLTFTVASQELPDAAIRSVITIAHSFQRPGLQVDLAGDAVAKVNPTGTGGVAVGVALAGVVLFLAFGSLLAMFLPLATALVSLGTGLALVGLTSHLLPSASFGPQLASLIGLGVGVDYALFIITRYRQALARGKTPEAAIVEALDTAGRAVMFAGLTVCITLLGMCALGIGYLYGVALAASITVLLTAAASLTLLPAILGFAGVHVLSRRERRRLSRHALSLSVESRGWGRWARQVQRRPGSYAALATLLMLGLALPLLGIRLGSTDAGNDPAGSTTRRAYDTVARSFGPGYDGPFLLVTTGRELPGVVARLAHDRDVAGVGPVVTLGGAGGRPLVREAEVFAKGAPQDASTRALFGRLRLDARGSAVLVGGETASVSDFSDAVSAKLPWFVGLVVALSSLLLMMVFRSLLIPLTAALLNLLSAGAAFGIVTAVFQDGWGAGLLGVTRAGPIDAFVPIMMFAVLFGLSMDYEVFILSRIFEELHRRGDNGEAVVHGLAATGRTVTAAGAIMVAVFAAFMLGGDRIIKLFGLGLAGAVTLDAFVVRALLVPAAMMMLGKANWWLPGVLDRRLPHLSVEGGHTHELH